MDKEEAPTPDSGPPGTYFPIQQKRSPDALPHGHAHPFFLSTPHSRKKKYPPQALLKADNQTFGKSPSTHPNHDPSGML